MANILRLDFLNFYGKNPTKWISKANQLFSYYQNPPYQKILRVFFLISKYSLIESLRRPFKALRASYRMKGDALVWFQEAKVLGCFTSWEQG